MSEEKAARTRNMGEIRVQGLHDTQRHLWEDVLIGGMKSFETITDAGEAIEDHGAAGVAYRIVRVYPPVKVTEVKRRTLEPA